MATISNTPRPGYVWDATDNCWYPIGTGPHSHADYITSSSAINPNIVDAKGDIIAATAADTVARLAVGSNDQVLTADSSTATGLKWATPAAGGMTQLATGSLSGTSTNISGISGSYRDLYLVVKGFYSSAADPLNLRFNSSSTGYEVIKLNNGSATPSTVSNATEVDLGGFASGDVGQQCVVKIYNYADDSSYYKPAEFFMADTNNSTFRTRWGSFMWRASKNAISSIQLLTNSATSWSGGTYTLYGVK